MAKKQEKNLLVDTIDFVPTEITDDAIYNVVSDDIIVTEETEIEHESAPIIVPKVIDIVNKIPVNVVTQSPKNEYPYDVRPGFIQYRQSGNFNLHPEIVNFMIDPNLKGGTVLINKNDINKLQEFLSTSNLYQYETTYPVGKDLLNIRFRTK